MASGGCSRAVWGLVGQLGVSVYSAVDGEMSKLVKGFCALMPIGRRRGLASVRDGGPPSEVTQGHHGDTFSACQSSFLVATSTDSQQMAFSDRLKFGYLR